MAGHPFSIRPQSGLNRSHSSIPHPVSTGGSGPTSTRKSHYRPFSSQSSYVDLATAHSPSLRRSASVGGLHQFCNNMGLQFGSKGRKELVRPNSPAILPSVPDASSLRPTKKRSMASIFVAPDPFTAPPSPSPKCSDELPVIDISKNHGSHEELDTDKFMPKDIWAKRCNMKLHPYHKQVTYMQAYDPVSLESDRYTDLLFQRLTDGSPSFHDYGKKPPAMVLDLGCGQGHWILHAANVWKSTDFVGLDIVDTTPPAFDSVENVRLIRGDFVNYKFPFPDDTFDFVRMANLALCIPYDKWELVLGQVHRVLTPGGRLELIDDDIYFPYGKGWKGIELEALVPPSPLSGSFCGAERLDVDDNEMRQCEDTDSGDSMNPEASIIAGAADSIPVTSNLLSESAGLRLPCRLSRKSSLSPASPHDSLLDTQHERTDLILKQTMSSRSPTPGDRPQWPGSTVFGKSAARHIGLPSPRKDGKLEKSSSPCPKRTREKVALLPPIRSIMSTFSLPVGSKFSPGWSPRTENSSPTGSDASSISSTDTTVSTSISSIINKVDPENSVWQKKVFASKNMESLFEKMLVEQYGIHPRPSEFMLRVFGKVFHEDENGGAGGAQVKMIKSFHIKLAPTIGDQSDNGHVGGKERVRGSMEEADGVASTSTGMSLPLSTVDANSKPQKQAIPITSLRSRPWQGQNKRLKVDRPRTKKEKDEKNKPKQEEQEGKQFKLKRTQAGAVKTTATMTVSLFKGSQRRDPTLSTPVLPTLSAKAAGILGIPYSELSTVTLSLAVSPEERQSTVKPLPSSFPSNLSAKAAGRFGVTYSEALSAALSLSVPRNAAHLAVPSSPSTFSPTPSPEPAPLSNTTSGPVQHTGLLIWPDTYVPMAAGELEMHSCKYIHTLLSCRPALEEFIAKFVDGRGVRFVGEEEFRDEIWEYECFRRARFNWPSEAAEPYEDDPTNPNAAGPSSPIHCTTPNGSDAGTAGSVDANYSTASTLDLPAIHTTGSVSANGLLHSRATPHQPCTTDDLRPTKSSLLRSPSPPVQRSPLSPFLPKPQYRKIYTSRNLRSASPSPPSSSCPRRDSFAKSSRSMTKGNRGYRKLDELVHLRSIKVFEGIKAA